MQSKNPVLSRIGQPNPGGSGFAYDEGIAAYQSAGQATYVPGGALPTGAPTGSAYEPVTNRMSMDDVVVKTGISLVVLIIFAGIGWMTAPTMPWLYFGAMLAGLALGLVNAFKRVVSPILVLLYAAFEGVFLGGISYAYNQFALGQQYPGLVQQAVLGTLVAFGVTLALYSSRIVRVNGTFMKVMMVAMVSYLVIAFASFIAALFGVGGGWGFYGVGGLGLLLCGIGVALAAFSLMIDFEAITQGVRMGLPEREAWRMSFGLLVTLIWLYLEILRFLAILASGRD